MTNALLWKLLKKSVSRYFFLDLLFYAYFFINLFELVGDSSSPLRITSLKPTLHLFKFKKHAISGFEMPKFTEALASCLTNYAWVSA